MCIYCEMWGDGMTWYLNPKNYPRHMYTLPKEKKEGEVSKPTGEADPAGYINLERSIIDAMEKGPEEYEKTLKFARDMVDATQGTVGGWMGQAVPLRDMEKMVELCNPLGVIACICRKAMLGIEQARPVASALRAMGHRMQRKVEADMLARGMRKLLLITGIGIGTLIPAAMLIMATMPLMQAVQMLAGG